MESKHEKRKAVLLEALEILRDSRKIPPSSSSLVEEVDSLPPGHSSVFLMSEVGRKGVASAGRRGVVRKGTSSLFGRA